MVIHQVPAQSKGYAVRPCLQKESEKEGNEEGKREWKEGKERKTSVLGIKVEKNLCQT